MAPGLVWASIWAGTTPSENPAYTRLPPMVSAARVPRSMISPKPISPTWAMPAWMESNVRPIEQVRGVDFVTGAPQLVGERRYAWRQALCMMEQNNSCHG